MNKKELNNYIKSKMCNIKNKIVITDKETGYFLIGEMITFANNIHEIKIENSAIIEKIIDKKIYVKNIGKDFLKFVNTNTLYYGTHSLSSALLKDNN